MTYINIADGIGRFGHGMVVLPDQGPGLLHSQFLDKGKNGCIKGPFELFFQGEFIETAAPGQYRDGWRIKEIFGQNRLCMDQLVSNVRP